jgi:Ras GTPase-activating-like protein IQGAP2/3
LRVCLNELGQAPSQLLRSENKSIVLPLKSRWEQPITDIPSAIADSQLTPIDILYMDVKAIFVQILRVLSKNLLSSSSLREIAKTAASSKNPVLANKGATASDMLTQLEQAMSVDECQVLLKEEIDLELEHLGNVRENIRKELVSLEGVYSTIIEHNGFLKSQLEYFKTYLQNVRGQAGLSQVKSGKAQVQGPFKFSYSKMESDGIILESQIPENRRSNLIFTIISPVSGTFILSLEFKGINYIIETASVILTLFV